MAAVTPVEILLGVYLGLLTGIVPALIAGSLGFLFRYFTGVTVPALAVVVLAVAVAGVSGGLLGLIDPTISQSPRLLVAVLVVMMLSLYAHSQGDKLGAAFPKRFSLRRLRRQTLSTDVVDFVGGIGHATIRPAGEIGDVEGYPSLTPALREQLRTESWRFPADLPLPELERRLERRLETEYDLAAVCVSIDVRGRATIDAAPPAGGLSRRVPEGERAVSIDGLVPTGLARGDRVAVRTDGGRVTGAVLSARSSPEGGAPFAPGPPDHAAGTDQPPRTDGGAAADEPAANATPLAPTTTGGEGRLTVAVPTSEAETLLRADRGRFAVQPGDVPDEYAVLSALRRSGKRVRSVTMRAGGPLEGTTLDAAGLRERHGVAVLAIERAAESRSGWQFEWPPEIELEADDELIVAGSPNAVGRFRELAG